MNSNTKANFKLKKSKAIIEFEFSHPGKSEEILKNILEHLRFSAADNVKTIIVMPLE